MRMVYYFCFLITVIICSHTTIGIVTVANAPLIDFFSLNTTSTWREYQLENRNEKSHVWACSLILKSKKPGLLTKIKLHWQGEHLTSLSASLYQKKEREAIVIPIQNNLVCDGMWNPAHQEFIFNMREKIIAVNKYHLFLSFPAISKNIIRSGSFTLSSLKIGIIKEKDRS